MLETLRLITWKVGKCQTKVFSKLIFTERSPRFSKDVEVRLTDKTQASYPTRREFYWIRTFGTLYPDDLNVESDY